MMTCASPASAHAQHATWESICKQCRCMLSGVSGKSTNRTHSGIAAYALLRALCGGSPARFQRFDCRFSAPVYPGETIRTEIWSVKPGSAAFRCRAVERDIVILNNGIFEFAAG